MSIFKFIGALGLLLISIGIVNKKRFIQDILYIIGGICLEIYSIHLGDLIFIILQIIFIIAAIYDSIKLRRSEKNKAK
ncbi:MAG: hypothetical protein COZ28_02580 [Candidatus Moranbacteria bacterium CG_4_10_14_3_um_filter_44_15]|nr:MAG: hypothetical protein COS72_00160 [Candidatus Moranbacteria bacterium CG06_land_8_20_14_3_00_43_56]PIV83930.1 MAG: hypothetical protein COW51_02220 [Candidatus Moranbacteria bacterium CG17_big_fil_post_rev_8_21_14_2_50_44_12]PIW93205.1 MAG: hypothetical protein COZ87_02745 [Candidatus Moranbacteria bacterium CG_4_8_14_3_um_filter_43_15]PIX90620.1 MAG: hypothetical protein COZ28_02580 [Candidatus Moranbacteria bacterium CG_4_10_14_3_um_filter_44_15]PJA85515.1 MAG: hypothetical protein CO1